MYIRLLGDILGNVIKVHEGIKVFDVLKNKAPFHKA